MLKNGHFRGGVFATRHTSTSSAPFTRATRVRAPDQQIWGRACASMSSCKNTPPKSCKKNRISNTTSPLGTKLGGYHAYHLGVLTPKGEFKIDHIDRFTASSKLNFDPRGGDPGGPRKKYTHIVHPRGGEDGGPRKKYTHIVHQNGPKWHTNDPKTPISPFLPAHFFSTLGPNHPR